MNCQSAKVAPPALLCSELARSIYTSVTVWDRKKKQYVIDLTAPGPRVSLLLCDGHSESLRRDLRVIVGPQMAPHMNARFTAL